jgi:hypothetical protein
VCAKGKITVILHTFYQQHLASCGFLFPLLKIALKERRFNYITMIQTKARDILAEVQTMHCRNTLDSGTISKLAVHGQKETRQGFRLLLHCT